MKRWLSIETAYLLTALGGVVVVVYVALTAINRPPPLHYTERYYTPSKAVYAPGETIEYSPTLRFRDWGPSTFRRTFWNRDLGAAAKLCDGSDAPVREFGRNLPFETVGEYREGNAREIVPNLPPGNYWLIGSVEGDRKSQYQIPFRIVQNCDG